MKKKLTKEEKKELLKGILIASGITGGAFVGLTIGIKAYNKYQALLVDNIKMQNHIDDLEQISKCLIAHNNRLRNSISGFKGWNTRRYEAYNCISALSKAAENVA